MKKSKPGQYIYRMEIPVIVSYSKRDDGSVGIDLISYPTEEELSKMIDVEAKQIKAGAEIRG